MHESQPLWASIVSSAMDAIVIIDADQRIVFFNAAAERMFRCSADEVVGGSLDGFIPERFRAAHKKHVRDFGQTNVAKRGMNAVTIFGLRSDGEEFPIEASISQVEVGGEKFYTAILRDVTDRKCMEEALRESELNYRSIFDAANDAIFIHDMESGSILDANQRMREMYGYTVEEIQHLKVEDLSVNEPPYTQAEALRLIRKAADGEPQLFPWRAKDKAGRLFWVEVSLKRAFIRGKDGLLAVVRDITQRRLAEEKLREQAALLDQATDAILDLDFEGQILFWSKGAERIYGWTAEEAVGRNVRELYHQRLGDDAREAKRILLEKGMWSGEVRHVSKDGKPITVESRWTLLRDAEGRPKTVLVINSDITERRQLEAQFLRAQRLESLGALAGGIAHDINNVLSPILMAIRMLQMRFPDPDSHSVLNILQTNAERGSNMVRQILEFARGAEGERVLLEPERLIKEIINVIGKTLPKTIEVRSFFPESLWPVNADPTQLHQVLMNLLVNARDAMPHGGRITVEASNVWIDEHYARMELDAQVGCYVCVAITDTGTGIAAGIMDNIFDPFFTTKEFGKGTGLGLSTVMGIVKSHGGFLKVSSEAGVGTEFEVYLPAAEAAMMKQANELNSEPPLGHGELILVVDDEWAVREVSKDTLETHGYKVLTASDGTEAVALFAQHGVGIRAVLMDMMMPYLDGPAAIRALRKLNPEVKIIVSSGLKVDGKPIEAASAGVNVFLWKPYTADKLLKAVANVLASA
jgi:PAS domain S-box-containing protein